MKSSFDQQALTTLDSLCIKLEDPQADSEVGTLSKIRASLNKAKNLIDEKKAIQRAETDFESSYAPSVISGVSGNIGISGQKKKALRNASSLSSLPQNVSTPQSDISNSQLTKNTTINGKVIKLKTAGLDFTDIWQNQEILNKKIEEEFKAKEEAEREEMAKNPNGPKKRPGQIGIKPNGLLRRTTTTKTMSIIENAIRGPGAIPPNRIASQRVPNLSQVENPPENSSKPSKSSKPKGKPLPLPSTSADPGIMLTAQEADTEYNQSKDYSEYSEYSQSNYQNTYSELNPSNSSNPSTPSLYHHIPYSQYTQSTHHSMALSESVDDFNESSLNDRLMRMNLQAQNILRERLGENGQSGEWAQNGEFKDGKDCDQRMVCVIKTSKGKKKKVMGEKGKAAGKGKEGKEIRIGKVGKDELEESGRDPLQEIGFEETPKELMEGALSALTSYKSRLSTTRSLLSHLEEGLEGIKQEYIGMEEIEEEEEQE